MSKPKVLFWDLECTPSLGYVWGLYDQNVIAVKKEWELLSVAWKWQGESSVHCVTRKGKKDDHVVASKIHELLSKADISVAHNGDQFDVKKAKARMIFHSLTPVKPSVTVDTKKVAKNIFNFNSNSLNHLGKYFSIGSKVQHTGFSLWEGCMKDDRKAWKTMEKYNKQDVVLLEKVYNKMLPWMPKHPNMALLMNNTKTDCPKCGSMIVKKDGIRANSSGLQQQMKCNSCKGYYLLPLRKH